ncbi:MAG: hypothetical protein KGD57_04100 [Candidatus Lokiarchaeota archaeon]|nr:hypothetical protein [Candidatus Lokiarchaeota archaeon]
MSNSKLNQMEIRKKKYKILLSLIGVISLISYITLFYFLWPEVNAVFSQIEGIIAVSIIFFRISICALFSYYLLHKWFKQEAIYPSDAYFLFALFFIILILGKSVDLSISLIVFSEAYDPISLLIFLKLRYIIITLNAIPLLYLGLEVIINLFDTYVKHLSKHQFNLLKLSIISTFLLVISMIILTTNSLELILNVLPVVTTLTMVGIVILFILMYRIKRLSQANGLIIGLGFLLIIISSLFRPSLTKGFNISMLVFAELVDQALYIIIFVGFIKKPKYAKLNSYIEMRTTEIKEIS